MPEVIKSPIPEAELEDPELKWKKAQEGLKNKGGYERFAESGQEFHPVSKADFRKQIPALKDGQLMVLLSEEGNPRIIRITGYIIESQSPQSNATPAGTEKTKPRAIPLIDLRKIEHERTKIAESEQKKLLTTKPDEVMALDSEIARAKSEMQRIYGEKFPSGDYNLTQFEYIHIQPVAYKSAFPYNSTNRRNNILYLGVPKSLTNKNRAENLSDLKNSPKQRLQTEDLKGQRFSMYTPTKNDNSRVLIDGEYVHGNRFENWSDVNFDLK